MVQQAQQVTCCENLVFAWRPPGEGEEAAEGTNILYCGSCGTDWKPGSPFAPEPVAAIVAPPLPPAAVGDDSTVAILTRLDAILINQSQQQTGPVSVSGGGGVYQAAWMHLLDGLDQNASWGKNKLREFMLECFKAAGGSEEAEEEAEEEETEEAEAESGDGDGKDSDE